MSRMLTASECAGWLDAHDDYLIISHRRPAGSPVRGGSGQIKDIGCWNKCCFLVRSQKRNIENVKKPMLKQFLNYISYEFLAIMQMEFIYGWDTIASMSS